jgi:hypothetical protein
MLRAPEATPTDLPDDVVGYSELSSVEYTDCFLIAGIRPGERSAEGWARHVLEGAPADTRSSLRSGWTRLGLRLQPFGAPGTVLGWEISRAEPDRILLGASSRIGMPGELFFERRADDVLFATLVHLGNPAARAVWAAARPIHLRVVEGLLTRAAEAA